MAVDSMKVSVIFGVYNRADQALACLDSLARGSIPGMEIIVVDDASTDDLVARVEDFRRQRPEVAISVVRNPRNLGASGARNVGIDAAQGEIVCFTDSDCTVEPTWIPTLLAAFAEQGVAAVTGVVIDHPPRTYAELAYVGAARLGISRMQGRKLVGGNMAFRRTILAHYKFEPTVKYGAEEDDLAWRLTSDGHRIGFAEQAVCYHNHPLTVSSYLRMGRNQGAGAARYWYKRGWFLGRDMILLTLSVATLPPGFFWPWLLAIPLAFLLLHLASLWFNQRVLKGKSMAVAFATLPLEFLYYCWKAAGICQTYFRILFGYERELVEAKRQWWSTPHPPTPSSST